MSIHVVCEESVSSVKSSWQSKQSGHLLEVIGPKGPLFAGSWLGLRVLEISNSSLSAYKEEAGSQEASCGQAVNSEGLT